jgi:hypothetical protein
MTEINAASTKRSQLVRDYANSNPGAKVPDIVKHFETLGITISASLAYNALSYKPAKSSIPKRGRPRKSTSVPVVPSGVGVGVGVSVIPSSGQAILDATITYLKVVGSIDRAMETLKILKQIG